MKPDQLASAIKKLRRAHKLGRKIADKLDSGDGVQYRKVGYRKAAKLVSEEEKLETPLSPSKARTYVMFTRKYSRGELNEFIALSREQKHCPGFDVVVRLMGIGDKKRRLKLTLQVLKNRWEKVRLGQEMRLIKATKPLKNRGTDSYLDPLNRGRKPKAVLDIESLFGELQDDAVRWRRIYKILIEQRDPKKKDAVGLGAELSVDLMKDLKRLTNMLNGFFEYE